MQGAANSISHLIATAIAAIALTGCASNAPRIFDEYAETSKHIETIYLINDVLVQNDVKGAHDRVDVNENRDLLGLIAGEVRKTLTGKGYRVEAGSVDTVGAIAGRDTQFAVYRGETDACPGWNSEEHTELQWSPFHYNDTIEATFIEDHVKLLHQRLTAIRNAERLKAQTFQSATEFALPANSAILVTQSTARCVPGGKKGAQMLLTAILTAGMFTTWEESTLSHRLVLLDAQSGDVLWADLHAKAGGRQDEKNVRLAIEKAFKALPDRTTDQTAGRPEAGVVRTDSI